MLPDGSRPEDWVSVFSSATRRPCEEQALVLKAMDIAHFVTEQPDACHLMVPEAAAARARDQLGLYRRENPQRLVEPWPAIAPSRGLALATAWIVALSLAYAVQVSALFGLDWLGAGELVAGRVRAGEWWRVVTALSLHADIEHVIGNIVFGAFFAYLAGQHLGSGVAALGTVALAGLGNAANAFLQVAQHRSIGASTAVFAALGLVAAVVLGSSRRQRQQRPGWARRWSPAVGAVALLAYTGTGDEHTDVFAHLAGFLTGVLGGTGLHALGGVRPGQPWRQAGCGLAAAALLALAWWRAFL